MRASVAVVLMLIGLSSAMAAGSNRSAETIPVRSVISLDLGRLPPSGGTVWLSARTGRLPLGTVLRLSTPDGRWSVVLTPFGIHSDAAELTFQVPVPAEAVTGTRLNIVPEISGPNTASHTPTERELLGISLLGE